MDYTEIIFRLIKSNSGLISTADAVKAGVPRLILSRLAKDGTLVRVAQGQYILPNNLEDELYMLQQRSGKIIFSHETALFLHNMAERTPFQHSLTIPGNYRLTSAVFENCKVYYVKPELHGMGKCSLLTKMGHEVTVYDIERTVCDILRSRNRMDNQTVVAAMKNYTAAQKQDYGKLREYAEAFCITKILRQYLEVLL